MRLFAGDRIYKILDRLGTTDEEGNEEPIEAGMLSKQIEKAQRKVEEQNFLIRKRVLEYDDVMNEQRRIVYEYRDDVLEGKRHGRRRARGDRRRHPPARRRVHARRLRRGVGPRRPVRRAAGHLPDRAARRAARSRPSNLDREELIERLTQDAVGLYDRREAELGDELMRALERYLLLQIIDNRWREHLYDMDYLREGIHLRGFAQIEPIVAYKNEAFELFPDLMNTIWSDFARMVFHVEVEVEGENGGAAGAVRAARRASRRAAARRGPARSRTRAASGPRSPARSRSRRGRRRRRGRAGGYAESRPTEARRRSSSSAASTRPSRSAATTRAGAARARSSRSATAPDGRGAADASPRLTVAAGSSRAGALSCSSGRRQPRRSVRRSPPVRTRRARSARQP